MQHAGSTSMLQQQALNVALTCDRCDGRGEKENDRTFCELCTQDTMDRWYEAGVGTQRQWGRLWDDLSLASSDENASAYSEEVQDEVSTCQPLNTGHVHAAPKVTVVKPFRLTQSSGQKSRSLLEYEEELECKRAAEEAELQRKFRAQPCPGVYGIHLILHACKPYLLTAYSFL